MQVHSWVDNATRSIMVMVTLAQNEDGTVMYLSSEGFPVEVGPGVEPPVFLKLREDIAQALGIRTHEQQALENSDRHNLLALRQESVRWFTLMEQMVAAMLPRHPNQVSGMMAETDQKRVD